MNKQIIIKHTDLPLSCDGSRLSPGAFMEHPKIYMLITNKKPVVCPYCGLEYILIKENFNI